MKTVSTLLAVTLLSLSALAQHQDKMPSKPAKSPSSQHLKATATSTGVSMTCTPPVGGSIVSVFGFYRAPATGSTCGTGLTYTLLGTAATCAYSDSTVSPGKNYCYEVNAENSAGNSAKSSPAIALMPGFTISLPATLSVTEGNPADSVTVTVNPINGGVGTLALSASGLPSGVTATFNPASTSTTSTLTFAVALSAPAGTSTVTVTAANASGTVTQTATLSLTVNALLPPNPPTNLIIGTVQVGKVVLQWTPPGNPIYAYRVDRKPDTKANWTQIASGVTAPTYTDKKSGAGTFDYQVKSVAKQGSKLYVSGPSNVAKAVVP